MNPPANWYPDPTGRHEQRYWDGEQWTEHVFTEGVQGVDGLDGGAPGTATAATEVAGTEAASTDATGATAATAADQGTWTPEEQAEETASDDQEVAREVQPQDVVGNLDEVGDGESGPGVAAESVAPAAGDGGTAATEDDFSDAFMVTPETVSRLVAGPHDETSEPPQADVESPAEGAAAGQEAAADAASGAIVAPPPTMGAPTSTGAPTGGAGGLGISGDLVGGAFAEREEAGPVALQNSRLLRCSLGAGPGVVARQGTMVAYQGEVSFERQGAGGVARALKRAATGEGLAMMRADGAGDVFFADGAQHVFLLHLEGGPGLSVNGRNVLAFSAALQWDIERVKGATLLAGGLFNTTLTGTGWVALVSDGEPVVLRTDEAPTYVDVNALVAWSGGLTTRITNTVSAKSLVGLGSGEAFQMAFEGIGIVIVQPSEGPMGGAAAAT